jgi:hypothetical protein
LEAKVVVVSALAGDLAGATFNGVAHSERLVHAAFHNFRC